MRELDQILEAWRQDRQALYHSSSVLATVVRVEGSAYRRPGARMLIHPQGAGIGSISGGCLEGDLRRKAAWWTSEQPVALRVYDTTSDDDAVWEFGLGCNGVIHVLLERFDAPGVAESLDFLAAAQARREPTVIVTSISPLRLGQRWCFPRALPEPAPAALAPAVEAALTTASSRILHTPTETFFVEYVPPPQRLFVFGAGHDARPLVQLGAELGWQVHLADGRPAYACPANFPNAASVRLLPPDASLEAFDLGPGDAVVMMTHNFPQDIRLLPQILARRPRYLGLLGPHSRAHKLFTACGLTRIPSFVHAPVGLDIGSDAPATVALSIVAEIQAALNQRSGGALRSRSGSIHESILELGSALGSAAPTPEPFTCEVSHA